MKGIYFRVQLCVLKPIGEVFSAIAEPEKLAGYFVKTASAPLREGERPVWVFPEFPDSISVEVLQATPDTLIRFRWPGDGVEGHTDVEITFEELEPNVTRVTITESGWTAAAQDNRITYRNCMGWMHMLCGLKAYLEYGVNLRKGAFLKFDHTQL